MKRLIIVSAIIACIMLAGCKISGTISDDGTPVSGVTVIMSGPVNKTVVTNSKGQFSFTPFKPGTYTLRAESTAYKFYPEVEKVVLGSSPVSIRFEARNANSKALVIVNSASAFYSDYINTIKPVLDSSSAQKTVLDIAVTQIGTAEQLRAVYDLIIIGHRQIDINKTYLSTSEQRSITDAVAAGVGLVNLDNDLTEETEGTPITFSCVDNANQDPVISKTGIEIDDMWSEYAYDRPFSTLFAHTLETVPVMRLHKTVSNGFYRVYARLYNPFGMSCKYYFGLNKSDPMDQFVNTASGLPGEAYQHNWYFLDNVKVTSGELNIYIQNAQFNHPNNYYFGWAEIRLVPVAVKGRIQFVSDIFKFNYTPAANESHMLLNSGYFIMCSDNDVQDPDIKVSTLVPDDNQWSEFTYNRPFATVFGYSAEFLPVLGFHQGNIEPDQYDVYANVYSIHGDAVYYYGWDINDATGSSFAVKANTPAQKYEHTEYKIATLNLADSFDIYVQDAELESSEPYYFGWAWVRLAPVNNNIHKIISGHKAADTVFTVDGTMNAVTMKVAGISMPSDGSVEVLATTLSGSKKPVIASTVDPDGMVFAAQFGTYDWLNLGILGYNDLIINAIEWASF